MAEETAQRAVASGVRALRQAAAQVEAAKQGALEGALLAHREWCARERPSETPPPPEEPRAEVEAGSAVSVATGVKAVPPTDTKDGPREVVHHASESEAAAALQLAEAERQV